MRIGRVRRRLLGVVHAAAGGWMLGTVLWPPIAPLALLALVGAWEADRVLRGGAEP